MDDHLPAVSICFIQLFARVSHGFWDENLMDVPTGVCTANGDPHRLVIAVSLGKCHFHPFLCWSIRAFLTHSFGLAPLLSRFLQVWVRRETQCPWIGHGSYNIHVCFFVVTPVTYHMGSTQNHTHIEVDSGKSTASQFSPWFLGKFPKFAPLLDKSPWIMFFGRQK